MKKIMFTLLAACAIGATAQASAVDWSFTTKSTSTAAEGGTVYLILGTAGTYDSIAALKAAAIDSASASSGGGTKIQTGVQTWDGGTKAAGATDSFSYVLVDSGETGYYVAATGLTGTYYDPTDALTPKPSTMAKTVSTAITASSLTSFSGGSGGGGDVPEPTSGLLLLVGGAMLALRRKQK